MRANAIIDIDKESQDPLQFLVDVTQKYGDFVQYDCPVGRTYLLNHPDYIRQFLQSSQFQRTTMMKLAAGNGIFASDGEYWKRQRRLTLPFFHQDEIKKFVPLINAHTQKLLQRWSIAAERGESVDISAEMTRLTLAIIVEALFEVDLGPRIDELCSSLSILLSDLGEMMSGNLNAPLSFAPSSRDRFQTALDSVDQITEEIIDMRRKAPANPKNLLSHFLSVVDEETNEPMTQRQIRDEVVALMVSGHETTSLVLSWTLSILAENPEIQQQIVEELDLALGTRPPTLEDLDSLPYALMVLQETMRLYPPVWFIARKSVAACKVGDYEIPENVLVGISPYAMHRHPGFWNRPEVFDPLRFSPGAKQVKYSYLPFGGGRHLCLGMNFALIESQLILASIMQNFQVRLLIDRPIVPTLAITLRPPEGLLAQLVARQNARGAVKTG